MTRNPATNPAPSRDLPDAAKPVALALLAIALLAISPMPLVAADPVLGPTSTCSFSSTTTLTSCTFTCLAGQYITVTSNDPSGEPNRWPRTHMTCGGLDVYCQAYESCSRTYGPTTSAGAGTCYAETGSTDGSCTAFFAIEDCSPPNTVGAYVDGIGTCISPTLGTCDPPNSVGATVGGYGVCESVDIGTCDPPNSVGATVDGLGACEGPLLPAVGGCPPGSLGGAMVDGIVGAGACVPGPSTTAEPTSTCTFAGDVTNFCTFACLPGQLITITSNDPSGQPYRWPRTHATCGGVDDYCQSYEHCERTVGPTSSGGVGSCFAETGSTDGSCTASSPFDDCSPPSGVGGHVDGLGACENVGDRSVSVDETVHAGGEGSVRVEANATVQPNAAYTWANSVLLPWASQYPAKAQGDVTAAEGGNLLPLINDALGLTGASAPSPMDAVYGPNGIVRVQSNADPSAPTTPTCYGLQDNGGLLHQPAQACSPFLP